MIPRVLVVDAAAGTPDATLAPSEADDLEVTVVTNAADARFEVEGQAPDVIILDPALPDADSLSPCHWLRTWPGAPIIAVSSETDEPAQLALFAAGVDDVVAKPISLDLLRARIQVQLRHATNTVAGGDLIVVGALRLDTAAFVAEVAGRRLPLTPTLFRMLRVLAHNADSVVSPRVLARAVGQSDDRDPGNAVRIGISRLRHHLGAGDDVPQIINERLTGYRLSAPRQPSTPRRDTS